MSRDGRLPGSSVVFPLLLIAFGVLLLLWRWMPSFNPWPTFWKYWPLLLIFVGAGMIWDRTERRNHAGTAPPFPVGSTVGTLAFLTIFAILLRHNGAFHQRDWAALGAESAEHRTHSTEIVELKGARAVRLVLHMPSGQLSVQGGADRLLEADFRQGTAWDAPRVDYAVENGVGTLNINQQSANELVHNSDNVWKLRVNNEVPLELEVDVGAGQSDLNLSKLDLTRLEVNIGAGQVNVDLTGERSKDLRAQIHGGVGEAIVRLPKSTGVVATVHGGLGSIDVHGLKEEDGRYVNAAYGKAPNTLHLTIEGGIGHIKLEQE